MAAAAGGRHPWQMAVGSFCALARGPEWDEVLVVAVVPEHAEALVYTTTFDGGGFAWALADPHRTGRERSPDTRHARATQTILAREHPRRESALAACELLVRARLHPRTTCEV